MQPAFFESQFPPEREQQVAIGAHDVRHALAVQAVAMEPDPPIERMTHSIKPPGEFPAGGYEQEMLPSIVAEPMAAALPENT